MICSPARGPVPCAAARRSRWLHLEHRKTQGPQTDECRGQVAQIVEANGGGVDPAIQRNVWRSNRAGGRFRDFLVGGSQVAALRPRGGY